MNYREKSEALQKLLDAMNTGDLTIEEMIETYEKGVALYRELTEELQGFEQRITMLSEEKEAIDGTWRDA
ncbi:MAG: exodeoxyribonuclease VII small subunit [Tissierellia bacterium]|nr:exodeoxyribonuclease VII small subunit [Tissierellia bacterium]